VEKEVTGRESEPWEIIYFKMHKTQIPVVEQAIETSALMLGTDKSTRLLPGHDLRRISICRSRRATPGGLRIQRAKGSCSSRTLGSTASARASATRCCWPRKSWEGYWLDKFFNWIS
jgi:hypothetical protein